MRPALAAIFLLCLPLQALAAPQTFVIDARSGPRRAQFQSKAPLESFTGRTEAVTGQITADPADIPRQTAAAFTVELATLKTGNRLRDRHMREEFLETDTYPVAAFTLVKILSLDQRRVRPGETVHLTARGRLTLHGVEREIEVPVDITYRGESVTATTSFTIELADYRIKRPQFLLMKLDETIRIIIEATARAL